MLRWKLDLRVGSHPMWFGWKYSKIKYSFLVDETETTCQLIKHCLWFYMIFHAALKTNWWQLISWLSTLLLIYAFLSQRLVIVDEVNNYYPSSTLITVSSKAAEQHGPLVAFNNFWYENIDNNINRWINTFIFLRNQKIITVFNMRKSNNTYTASFF